MKTFIRNLITIMALLGTWCLSNAQPKIAGAAKPVDTTSRGIIKQSVDARKAMGEALVKDHYYYQYPFSDILGVRYNNGISATNFDIYEGSAQARTAIISGVCPVEFSALGITEINASYFLYHIVLDNRTELVSWTSPANFKKTPDGITYAYLGQFNHPGHVLKVEIQSVKDYTRRDVFTVDWREMAAAEPTGWIQYTIQNMPIPDNGLFSKYITDLKRVKYPVVSKWVNGKKIVIKEIERVTDFLETTDKTDPKFHLADSIKLLSFRPSKGRRPYYYKVSLKRTVDGVTDSLSLGEVDREFTLYKEFWNKPGQYQITFTPKLQKPGGNPIKLLHELDANIKFTVLPALSQSYTVPLKTAAYIVLIIITTGGFMFMMYRSGQKRKLAAEAKDRQVATLQLASVRSQLNPHFMFNALAGIQNLMNKNEIESANKYLSRFARLTRNILDDGNNELTSIEKEASLLTDYLQMEQTRFGFNFSIDVDKEHLDQQIEIPAMLLQPFVENAVKHGVSSLKEKGMIKVGIAKQDSDIILTVQDNGKGFGTDQPEGMGFKLCRERIALLNSIYKKSTILLTQNSGADGTVIRIELRGWV